MPAFFSSTIPSVAPSSATALCSGVSTVPPPGFCCSNSPARNITRRIRPAFRSTISGLISPAFTAASTLSRSSQVPLLPFSCARGDPTMVRAAAPPGISRSIPAFTVFAVE